jgi:flagellar hook-associated protein 3 FlgL
MTSTISSFTLSSILRQTVSTAQTNLSNAELELSTGRYADVGLTLGAETGQSVSLRAQESLLQTTTASNNATGATLSSSQNILANLQSTAQSFLQSLIQSNDGNSSAPTLQETASTDLQTLVNQLNTNVNGQFIFGGINTGVPPINSLASGTTAVTNAFSGFLTANGVTAQTISPAQLQDFIDNQFTPLFQGSGPTSNWGTIWSNASDTAIVNQISPSETVTTSVSANQTAFRQLAQAYSLVANLNTTSLSDDTFQTVLTSAENLIQGAISGLTTLQSGLGNAQAAITSANNFMSTQTATLSSQIGGLENVDTFAVSTQASDLQTQIETAFSLTSQLQQLSLTKFL